MDGDDGLADLQEARPLNEAASDALNRDRRLLPPRRLGRPLRQLPSPGRLNADDGLAEVEVARAVHVAEEVLLEQGDEVVEPIGPELLERGEHAGAEEDLGQTALVPIRLGDRVVEDDLAQLLDLRAPLFGRAEHVVAAPSAQSRHLTTHRSANSSYVHRVG